MSGRLQLAVGIVLGLLIQLAGCHVTRQNGNTEEHAEMRWAGQRVLEHPLQAPDSCSIDDLELGQHGEVIKCFLKPNAGDFSIEELGSVPEETKCLVSLDVDDKNSVALRECKHGTWTASDLGHKKELHKRFLGFVIGIVVGCALFCGSGGGGGGGGSPKQPPTFSNPCRPSNLQNNYNVAAGDNSIAVTWTIPSATDPDGDDASVTVIQTNGNTPGSQFEGSVAGRYHYITHKATDPDGQTDYCSFDFTVTIQTCGSAAPWPTNGQRSCSQNNELGSVCTYTCNAGYQISGNSQITCQGSSAPAWSATPTCEKTTCSTPPTIDNGVVNCDASTPNEYLKVCPVTCDHNYTLSGNAFYTRCQADGTWLSVDSIQCKDSSPPQLSCITPQVYYADRSSTSTAVEWVYPTVTDNVDPNPSYTQTSGQLYGSPFQAGSSFVTYAATDSDGNVSPECQIEIRVEETTCQHPAAIIQDSNMEFTVAGTTYSYGSEASLSCKFNIALVGSDLLTCERDESASDLSVGAWSWGSGEQPFCNFTDCPDLDPPANGTSAAAYIGDPPVKVITMLCNGEFDIPEVSTGFHGSFYCQTDGTYTPDIDMPGCIIPRNPRVIRLPGEIYYYDGDCSDPATQEAIKSQLEQIFAELEDVLFRQLCPSPNNCTITDLTLTCEGSGRRKRHAMVGRDADLMHKTALRNRRGNGIRKRTVPALIVDFYLETKTDSDTDFLIDLARIDGFQDDVIAALQSEVTNGTFDIGRDFTINDQSIRAPEYGDIECETGFQLKQTNCLPCPYGYFLNASSLCELCPIGSYANESGLTSCYSCPSGQTTPSTGSISQDVCVEFCPEGQYSATGYVPCTPCVVGHYQDQTGQTSCTQCSTGTTSLTGSMSSSECQEFHLLLDDTSGAVTATASTVDMTDWTFTLWVKRYADEPTNAHIRLTSGGDDLLVLSLTNAINVQLPTTDPDPSNAFDMTIGELSSYSWSHVAISWDVSSEELSIYLNGQTAYNGMISLTPITNGNILMQSSGDSGVYIADLHLVDAVVSPSDISTMSTSCWTTRSGVFGMSDFRNRGLTGINIQTPLSCDPIDECLTNPCNDHTCVNGINDYTCYCSGGWSGNNCDTPYDYCLDNACADGATCVSGTSNFTCTCQTGYSGDLCDVAPVDGGWSEWSSWTSCTVTCNGGTQTRSRSCDSPEPSPQGANCTGDASETQTCGHGTCPTCPDLRDQGFKTYSNCTVDQSTGDQTCQIVCRDGYVLPASLQSDVFMCGISTEYEWSPHNNPPVCEDPDKPSRADIIAGIDTAETVSSDDSSALKQGVLDNLSSVPCVQDGICTPSVEIGTSSRRKRNTGSTITVTLTVEMTESGALDIQNYISTSTANPSLQELVDAINSLESSATYISSSSSSLFDVTVNGVTYTSSQSTLVITSNVTCPTGQTSTDGVCVTCPDGTYYTNGYCTFCDKGTYTSTSGQTSCTACPAGLTTVTIGSYAASQCTETETTTTTTSSTTTTQSSGSDQTYISSGSDKKAMYIGLAVALAALVISVGVCAFVVYKKKQNGKTCRVDSNASLRPQYPSGNSPARPKYPSGKLPARPKSPSKNSTERPKYPSENSHGTISLVDVDYAEIVLPSKNSFHNPTYLDDFDTADYIRPFQSPPPPYEMHGKDLVLPEKS